VHRELRHPDVTLALLWEEYRGGVTDGFSGSAIHKGQLRHTLFPQIEEDTMSEGTFAEFIDAMAPSLSRKYGRGCRA
jgi:hypothetical protein